MGTQISNKTPSGITPEQNQADLAAIGSQRDMLHFLETLPRQFRVEGVSVRLTEADFGHGRSLEQAVQVAAQRAIHAAHPDSVDVAYSERLSSTLVGAIDHELGQIHNEREAAQRRSGAVTPIAPPAAPRTSASPTAVAGSVAAPTGAARHSSAPRTPQLSASDRVGADRLHVWAETSPDAHPVDMTYHVGGNVMHSSFTTADLVDFTGPNGVERFAAYLHDNGGGRVSIAQPPSHAELTQVRAALSEIVQRWNAQHPIDEN